jgi:hypothetical protein
LSHFVLTPLFRKLSLKPDKEFKMFTIEFNEVLPILDALMDKSSPSLFSLF